MDTKKLRQKILDLAIHGKLVPQDPNDEPASVLLERIRAEKELMIKEGKIKKSKKVSKSSDTPHYGNIPFGVPESWAWCKLGNCCHIAGRIGFRGYTKDDLVSEQQGAITLSPSNIIDGIMNYTKYTYISWSKYEESPEIKVTNGDILLVKTGSSYGKCALVTELPQKATINPQFVVLKYIAINKRYLTIILQSDYARRNYNNFVLGTAIPTFTQAILGNMLVPLPPIMEQQRIVADVERWFALIDQVEQGKADLQTIIKQTKSKILDLAIHGKLVPQDPNDEPAIELLKRIHPDFTPCDNAQYRKLPNGWCGISFDDIFNITMGQSPDGCSINQQQGIEFHQGKLMFDNKYLRKSDMFTTKPTKLAKPNSLLLCVRAPVGVVNITQREICIGRGLCSLEPNEAINLDYAYYALTTYQSDFESKSTGSTFKAISGSIIRNEVFALPPIQEQHRVVAKIEVLFAQLDSIAAAI